MFSKCKEGRIMDVRAIHKGIKNNKQVLADHFLILRCDEKNDIDLT